jgi:4-amino-4-deoxy-L-arabinose transferase-like glycosyltransferase
MIALTWRVGRELYGVRTGVIAALLLFISPYFLVMQSGFMNHGTAALLLLLCFRLLVRLPASTRPMAGIVVAGVCAGYVAITRPLTAAAVLAPVGVYFLVAILPRMQRPVRCFMFGAGACVLTLSILPLFNYLTTGSALELGYSTSHADMHRLGYDETFTPFIGMIYSLNNLYAMNSWLFGWPIGSVVLLLVLLLAGRLNRWDGLLLATVATLSAAYALYRYQDFWYGPRFLYEVLPFLALLSARGAMVLFGMVRDAAGRSRALQLLSLPVLVTAAFSVAFAVAKLREIVNAQSGIHLSNYELISQFRDQPDAVVFVDVLRPDAFIRTNMRYPEGPLFPLDLGERNRELMEALPEREFFLFRSGELSRLDQ